jgi:XTP/dITP diphosphohydrolase
MRQLLSDLPIRIAGLEEYPGIPEAPEDADSFDGNAQSKALYYAERTEQWCLADDSGLEVDALGGAPGVRSARYARDQVPPDADRRAIDQANYRRLLRELDSVPPERRSARFVCQLALAEPGRIRIEARGVFEGRILDHAQGENGFGYDPVFFVPELNRTAAQLTPDEKNRISHRGNAVRQFAKRLREFLGR